MRQDRPLLLDVRPEVLLDEDRCAGRLARRYLARVRGELARLRPEIPSLLYDLFLIDLGNHVRQRSTEYPKLLI